MNNHVIKNQYIDVKYVCLGDIIGVSTFYKNESTRNANACVDYIRSMKSICTIGNHDLFHIKKTPKNSIFKYPKNWHTYSGENQYCINKFVWNYKKELKTNLTNTNIKYLNSRKEFHIERNILFSHFLYPDLTGSIAITNQIVKNLIPTHFLFMKLQHCFISFVGHLHIEPPFILSNKGAKEILTERTLHLNSLDGNLFIVFCPALVNFDDKPHKGIISYHPVKKTLNLIYG